MSFTGILLNVGGVILTGIVGVVAFFILGAVLAAYEYAKSPQAQMAEELEDNGTIEG